MNSAPLNGEAESGTADWSEQRCLLLDHSLTGAELRPFPSPETSKKACGIFKICYSTSDPEIRQSSPTQREVWDFLFSEYSVRSTQGGPWLSDEWEKKTFICIVCIYCLHNDATFKGYRNTDEFQV